MKWLRALDPEWHIQWTSKCLLAGTTGRLKPCMSRQVRAISPAARLSPDTFSALAGELAAKAVMLASGMRPLPETDRRDDPFFAHFPVLKKLLATAQGRRSGELRWISDNARLFQNWDTSMRYAPTGDIRLEWVDEWKDSAAHLIRLMETA